MASPFNQFGYDPSVYENLDLDNLLWHWKQAQEASEAAVYRERELRMLAFKKAVAEPKEGVNNIPLGNKWLLQATHNMNYKISKDHDAVEKALDKLPDHLGDRLMKWEPDLKTGVYKKELTREQHALIDPFITITPGLPTLKLLEPGAEGNKR